MRDINQLRATAAITGIGLAGMGDATGFTEMEILAKSAHTAVRDAGLKMSDIDGLFTASFNRFLPALSVAEYLGINPAYMDSTNIGGSAYVSCLKNAAMALNSGACNAVLVAYGSTAFSASDFHQQIAARAQLEPQPFEAPYAPFNPASSYALAAARHMHEYGTSREQLAAIAVAARQWAQANPLAFRRGPLTVEDVLSARMISDPLTTLDCCLITDGAGAFVMTRSDLVGPSAAQPVYILGVAASQTHRQISCMPDLTSTAARESGARAFAMAGLSAKDIHAAQLYDAFTINVLLFLEDLGFCAKGEGGGFITETGIGPGGALPVNTNGGGLSCVHPGMYGIFTVIEAVELLRTGGQSRGLKQIDAVLCHGNGGVLASQSTAILGTQATL